MLDEEKKEAFTDLAMHMNISSGQVIMSRDENLMPKKVEMNFDNSVNLFGNIQVNSQEGRLGNVRNNSVYKAVKGGDLTSVIYCDCDSANGRTI